MTDPIAERFEKIDRYTLRRSIGEGAFGVVYEAFDNLRDMTVALKVLRQHDPRDFAGFKREFRFLADVTHKHLLTLYDLVVEGDLIFFTMELIDGTHFLDAVGREAGLDRHRLTLLLPQLVDGINTLHSVRLLHCDLKPSNVLVTRENRLVVVDFGLVSHLANPSRALGSVGYMSPEQIRGEPLTEASDWYSVGALLHHALVGHPPLRGRATASLLPVAEKDTESIEATCVALLAAHPDERLARASSRIRQAARKPSSNVSIFQGRHDELAQLDLALRRVSDRPVVVTIAGPSGIGKTALVRRFLNAADANVVALTGRCHERELISYKAFDEIVDALARQLTEQPMDVQMATSEGRALAQIFPSLLRVLGRDTSENEHESDVDTDARELRRRAFAGLRRILSTLAGNKRVVIFIDDLQWTDLDSVALLKALFQGPHAPGLLLVVSHRDKQDDNPMLRASLSVLAEIDSSLIQIPVPPLSDEDALLLARAFAPDGISDTQMAAVAQDSHGLPLFIQQLADDSHAEQPLDGQPIDLHGLLVRRLSSLSVQAVRLLEALAIAGRPLEERFAFHAANLDSSASRPALLGAINARLAVTHPVEAFIHVETAHDRIRQVVVAQIPPGGAREQHRRLAELFRERNADPALLVEHYIAADDFAAAAEHVVHAAQGARAALAFDREASLLTQALQLPVKNAERWKLWELKAQALAHAGLGAEAAESYRQASAALASVTNSGLQRLTLERHAGEHDLRWGNVEQGTAALRAVLHAVGVSVPATRLRALAVTLVRRVRLMLRGTSFQARRNDEISSDTLTRLDALWGVTTSTSLLDFVTADALGVQHLLEALSSGSLSHVVRGLGYEAAFEAILGGRFFQRRCKKLLTQMTSLAKNSTHPYDRAWAVMSCGVTAWFSGDMEGVVRDCDEARRMYLEECRGVAWELAVTDAFCLPALTTLGRIAELRKRLPERLQSASGRGDRFAMLVLRTGQHNLVYLADDDVDRAREQALAGAADLPTNTYTTLHYYVLLALAQIDLYMDDGTTCLARLDKEWSALRTAQLLQVKCLKSEIHHLRARAALAALSRTEAGHYQARRRLIRSVQLSLRNIQKDPVPSAIPLAECVKAGLAQIEGNEALARHYLARCIEGFSAAGMRLYMEAARYRLGALAPEGDGLLADESIAWMRGQGIANPPAMVQLLVPGWSTS